MKRRSSRLPPAISFGRIAIDYGFLGEEQVRHCLAGQSADRAAGRRPRPLGRVALDEGLLDHDQVALLLAVQRELAARKQPEDGTRPAGPNGSGRRDLGRIATRLARQAATRRILLYAGFALAYVCLRRFLAGG